MPLIVPSVISEAPEAISIAPLEVLTLPFAVKLPVVIFTVLFNSI